MEIAEVDLGQIKISENNARKDLTAGVEDASIDDLANSIKEKGLLSPIILAKKSGFYELIAGQRRYLACQKLGWSKIPAIIREVEDDTDATILSLVENVHRADMSPIDKARAFSRIFGKYGNYNAVCQQTGVSTSTVRKYLKLLDLSPSVQAMLTTADGPAGVSALAKIAETFSPEDQEAALGRIGGFKQQIQIEMIKSSGGDLGRLDLLREQALEGAFDIQQCRGMAQCPFIPEELIDNVMKLVKEHEEKRKNEG